MSKKKATTFLTFAVTFELPASLNITSARALIASAVAAEVKEKQHTIKVHLLNKEVKYG